MEAVREIIATTNVAFSVDVMNPPCDGEAYTETLAIIVSVRRAIRRVITER